MIRGICRLTPFKTISSARHFRPFFIVYLCFSFLFCPFSLLLCADRESSHASPQLSLQQYSLSGHLLMSCCVVDMSFFLSSGARLPFHSVPRSPFPSACNSPQAIQPQPFRLIVIVMHPSLPLSLSFPFFLFLSVSVISQIVSRYKRLSNTYNENRKKADEVWKKTERENTIMAGCVCE